MSRYDGLIIPRSYSEYINKTDAATLLQALQLSGVMDAAPTAGSNHPVRSGGVYTPLSVKVEKALQVGGDNVTKTINLDKGVYLYFTNLHPFVTSQGLYLISVANTPSYNRIRTFVADVTISEISIDRETNVLSITSNSYLRGELIKITDIAVV